MAKLASAERPAQAEEKVQELVPARAALPSVAGVSTELAAEMESAPTAVSDHQEDRGTPLLYVAQKGSKQVDRQQAEFIEGLEVGDAFVNLTGEVFRAEKEGVDFLPCFFRANLMEWTPREAGGGFHGPHPRMTLDEMQKKWPGVRQYVDDKTKEARRDIWVIPPAAPGLPEHELILTHHYFGIIPSRMMPIVVPMASTNLRASQQMQALLDGMKVQRPDGRIVTAPGYFLPWKLYTVYASNDQGNWYRWAPRRGGDMRDQSTWTAPELRQVAAEFARLCAAGEVQVSKPLEDGSASSGTSTEAPL